MDKAKSWELLNVPKGIWTERIELGEVELGCPATIQKRTLHGGLQDGVDLVEIDNGALSVSVLPTRGMGIWRAQCGDLPLTWQSPVTGPVHPKFVNRVDQGGLGWLQGFDELVVRCGLSWNGAPGVDSVLNNAGVPTDMNLTLHGKIANLPAQLVRVEAGTGADAELAVYGEVDETMLYGSRLRLETRTSTRLGATSFTIADRVVNIGETDQEIEVLYHVNFGAPLLEEGARVVLPARARGPFNDGAAADIDTWDTYRGPTPGMAGQCYWNVPVADDDGNGIAVLHNAAADRGVALRFRPEVLPCVTVWKCTSGATDGYVTGIEPGTGLPNNRSFERQQGRVKTLAPGEAYAMALTIEALTSADAVRAAEAEAAAIQAGTEPEISRAPNPVYTAV